MGGCATKPKGFDFEPEAAPSEAPTSPDKAEGQNVAQVLLLIHIATSYFNLFSSSLRIVVIFIDVVLALYILILRILYGCN